MRRARLFLCAGFAALVAVSAQRTCAGETAGLVYQPSVFRSYETRFDDTRRFKKWVGMLERKLAQQPELDSRGCEPAFGAACGPYFWRQVVGKTKSADTLENIAKVNSYINQSPYVTDFDNWEISDFWEAPLEFLDRHGDCEDYAIAKYVTLKRLGFDPDAMRIVALNDTNLRIGHAVLMLRFGGRTYILDNQIKTVALESNILHYQVVYSINEAHWWMHIYR